MTLLDRLALGRSDLVTAASGLVLTVVLVAGVEHEGTKRSFLVMFGLAAFAAAVAGFMRRPHVMVALTVVYFAVLPTMKVFVTPLLGATKDLLSLSALTAAVLIYLERRRTGHGQIVEPALLVPIVLILGLYVVNLGGALTGDTGHGIAWFHGVRLFAEPLCLFVVGATLPDSGRTLRWGIRALLAACAVSAFYGILQQAVGFHRLVTLGYTYGQEVRTFSGGHLRSFGTLDEPFAYAGLLLLGFAVLLTWSRWRRTLIWLLFGLLSFGLLVSFVRTAALIAAALLALALARRGHGRYAVILMLGAVAAAVAAFVLASEKTATRTVPINSTTYLTLNGRTNIWASTLNSPADWIFGKGVGATGTASRRATLALSGSSTTKATGGTVVDSSYFAVIADVGIAGLALLATFFVGTFVSAVGAARRGSGAAWLGIGLLIVTLLDALTRESFTGFPTAYLAMLLLGLSYAVWRNEDRSPDERFAVP
jgi:hypothetical protein